MINKWSVICQGHPYDAESLNSGGAWGFKTLLTKSPDLCKAVAVYSCCLGVVINSVPLSFVKESWFGQ